MSLVKWSEEEPTKDPIKKLVGSINAELAKQYDNMGIVKVSELEGDLLDYWVAKADGDPRAENWDKWAEGGKHCDSCGVVSFVFVKRFTRDWSYAGPIIERERISILDNGRWEASLRHDRRNIQFGRTPLIAAMRCFVASKFGECIVVEGNKPYVTTLTR